MKNTSLVELDIKHICINIPMNKCHKLLENSRMKMNTLLLAIKKRSIFVR